MTISVGFDGTCVTDDYPKVGKEVGAAEALRTLQKRGHKIILNTPRNNRALADAVKWFKTNGIKLEGLVMLPKKGLSERILCNIHADLIIDRRAIGCPLIWGDHAKPYVDWVKVEELFAMLDRE